MKYVSTSKCKKSGKHGAVAKVVYDPLTGQAGVRCAECFAVLPGFTVELEHCDDGAVTAHATCLKNGFKRHAIFSKDAIDAYLGVAKNNEPSLDGGQDDPV